MAIDKHLKRIEALLNPDQGETSGYITADDILNAFREALLAVDENHTPGEDVVIGTLQQKAGVGGESLLDVLDAMRDVFARWDASIDTLGGGAKVKGDLPVVGGEAVPSTVAQTAQVLNNLIQALESMGLIRDVRGSGVVVTPPALVPIVGITAPTAPSKVWVFDPANATLPDSVVDLAADGAVGDAALSGASQAAFGTDEYLVLNQGQRVTWDGTNWGLWTPPLTGIVPPTGQNNFQWMFTPAGAVPPQTLADLKADVVVGDAALQALGNIDFTSGQFIALGDNSEAYFGALPGQPAAGTGAAGSFEWQAGKTP